MVPFLLLLIAVFNLIVRFWKFAEIPQLINPADYTLRLISGIINLFIPFLVFFIVLKAYKNKKLSLLTAFIFSLLPQSIVEGRIVSAPFILDISLFNAESIQKSLSNFMQMVSPSMLFFNNVTFYWGGIRELGIIYLSFIPFFIFGIYVSLLRKKIVPLLIIAIVFILMSSSKNFPESRLLYFTLPVFALIVSLGTIFFYNLYTGTAKKILFLALIFSVYELMMFLHFYFVHYPQAISGITDKIIYPF